MADCTDLTTLDAVKHFMFTGAGAALPNGDDFIIAGLITSISDLIAVYLGRKPNQGNNFLLAQTYQEMRNGNGNNALVLLVRPVITVSAVQLWTIALSSVQGDLSGKRGFLWDPASNTLYFRGGRFDRGIQNVQITYNSGWVTPGMGAVAALPDWAAATAYAQYAQIVHAGIVYTAIIKGTSGATIPALPTVIGASVIDGVTVPPLTWQASSVAIPPLPGAQFLPAAINLACQQETALTYKQRNRWGDQGYGTGTDRINYFMGAMHPTTKLLLDPYRDWAMSLAGGEVRAVGSWGWAA